MACACGGQGTCSCQAPEELMLQDEQGQLHAFYVADRLELDGQKYVFLSGVESADEVALLKVIEDGGSVRYSNIEDEGEWAKLQHAWFSDLQ
jgi:hypothetical protein